MQNFVSYIKAGSSVNVLIQNKIAISGDNVTWDFLSKENLDVNGIFSGSPGNNYPYPTKTLIVLKYPEKSYTFEAQAVKNQPAWTAGTRASMEQAIQDINTF